LNHLSKGDEFMSVAEYVTNDSKRRWRVYINLRSKVDPTLRVQKTAQGFESEAEALREEKSLKEDCLRELIKKEGSQPTFNEICLKWERYRRDYADIQEITIDDYLSAIKIWCEPIMNKPASEINKADIRLIALNLKVAEKSHSYQSKILNAVKRIYTWGQEEGLIKGGLENLTLGVKIKKANRSAPEILTAEEIRKLLTEAKRQGNPWYPIWAGAIFTGMRSGELYALTWDDIDFSNSLIMATKSYNKRKNAIGSTKGGYDRTVPINGALKELLLELRTRSITEEVFPRLRKWRMGLQAEDLRLFCIRIGIRSVKFHTLRACFATHLLSQGIPTTSVMKIVGWSGLKTMDIYVRRAGVCEKGATDCLEHLSPAAINENVIAFKA
jgi:integrase